MRNFRILMPVLILITTFSLNSCEIEPVDTSLLPENGGGTTIGYYIKVTKDGVEKQWTTVLAVKATGLDSFLLSAADASTSMNLTLFNVSKIVVYNLSWPEVSCNYTEGAAIFSSNYSDFNTSTGNITITELNKTNQTIKGTFNFIGKNEAMTATKVFTKGEFFINYTEQ